MKIIRASNILPYVYVHISKQKPIDVLLHSITNTDAKARFSLGNETLLQRSVNLQ